MCVCMYTFTCVHTYVITKPSYISNCQRLTSQLLIHTCVLACAFFQPLKMYIATSQLLNELLQLVMTISCALGDVMKESAQIALNWIRSNDQRVSECHCIQQYTQPSMYVIVYQLVVALLPGERCQLQCVILSQLQLLCAPFFLPYMQLAMYVSTTCVISCNLVIGFYLTDSANNSSQIV